MIFEKNSVIDVWKIRQIPSVYMNDLKNTYLKHVLNGQRKVPLVTIRIRFDKCSWNKSQDFEFMRFEKSVYTTADLVKFTVEILN